VGRQGRVEHGGGLSMSSIRMPKILPPGMPYRFVCEYGVDEYGLFFDFEVAQVRQRMRWIEPGDFMMGSPEDEPERSDDEKQHQVIITKGYWLADTTVTQELWQAVMGKNPAYFKDKDRPVEQVSWDDCQIFIARLNEGEPSLRMRLPSEAEWEYACRAGTQTPFSFGESITPDQVNYNGNFPFADGKSMRDRQETIGVKELPANAWGLHQMHGNVWEWCEDFFGEYPDGPFENPKGPKKGEHRVIRGGSWNYYSQDCRAAYRIYGLPDSASFNLGLRLARGQ